MCKELLYSEVYGKYAVDKPSKIEEILQYDDQGNMGGAFVSYNF